MDGACMMKLVHPTKIWSTIWWRVMISLKRHLMFNLKLAGLLILLDTQKQIWSFTVIWVLMLSFWQELIEKKKHIGERMVKWNLFGRIKINLFLHTFYMVIFTRLLLISNLITKIKSNKIHFGLTIQPRQDIMHPKKQNFW